MKTNDSANTSQEIDAINRRLQGLEDEKSKLLSRKKELESAAGSLIATSSTLAAKEKVALFQRYFVG